MKTQILPISLGICFATAALAQPADVRVGLVAYWPFEAIDAGTSPDLAFTNHLTAVSAPTVSPGRFNNALTLSGANYMLNTHTPDNSLTGLPIYLAGSYTIAMW